MTAPKDPAAKTVKDLVAEGFAERQQKRLARRKRKARIRAAREKDFKPMFFEGRGLV
jgi:hypothetical protein